MTSDEAHAQAVQWAEAWNKRDIEQVLDHFHDDVEFTSPTSAAVMGVPTMKGKAALREYWTTALSRISSLRFRLDRVLWDSAQRELAIIYTAEINGQSRRVSENLRFNDLDQVVAAEVFHGIAW
jgi:ketosteroid isomerase-like protein